MIVTWIRIKGCQIDVGLQHLAQNNSSVLIRRDTFPCRKTSETRYILILVKQFLDESNPGRYFYEKVANVVHIHLSYWSKNHSNDHMLHMKVHTPKCGMKVCSKHFNYYGISRLLEEHPFQTLFISWYSLKLAWKSMRKPPFYVHLHQNPTFPLSCWVHNILCDRTHHPFSASIRGMNISQDVSFVYNWRERA